MGYILFFLFGCLIGLLTMALWTTHKQRAVCRDWWEYAALFFANLLTQLRFGIDGLRTLVMTVALFVVCVFQRLRESYRNLKARQEAGQ